MKSGNNKSINQLKIITSGIFSSELSKISQHQQEAIHSRRFFELSVSFFYLLQKFSEAEEHFALLSFFYENSIGLLPDSELESKVISLRLVYLYSSQKLPEYHSLRSLVSSHHRKNSDFRNVDDFVYFLEIGNFASALNAIANISPVHRSILAQIEDSHKVA